MFMKFCLSDFEEKKSMSEAELCALSHPGKRLHPSVILVRDTASGCAKRAVSTVISVSLLKSTLFTRRGG